MGGYGQLDKLIIAEIEETLRRNADDCSAEAARIRNATSEAFADDVRAEIANEAARRYRQLADAVERNIFAWLDFEDIDTTTIRQRPLTPADVLNTMTPGQALIAMSDQHFAITGGA